MSVFRKYDVRGKYPGEISEEFAYKLGRALVDFLDADKILVGMDARESSPNLKKSLIEGIVEEGADAYDAGLITTPMLYYFTGEKDFDGGIVVTASHNPQGYNGFKMLRGDNRFIGGESGLPEIKALVELDEFEDGDLGTVEEIDLTDEYVAFQKKYFKGSSDVNIIVDCSNGSAGPYIEPLLDELGIEYDLLFQEPDGSFPNHSANPLLPESQERIKQELKNGSYDLGALFDGDGDRIIFFDEEGSMLKSSTLMALMCRHYYENIRGKKVVLDVLNYRTGVVSAIRETGAEPVPCSVGFTNVQAALRKNNAECSAEFSGHYSHRETHYCDNSMLMLMKVLSCTAKTGDKMSKLAEDLETLNLTQVNYEVEDKDGKIDKIDKEFSDAEETLEIDGVSKTYPDFWFNVRKSNTQPLLRVTVEAGADEKVEEVLSRIQNILGVEAAERY